MKPCSSLAFSSKKDRQLHGLTATAALRGFTLIELMVVVAIVAILAGLAAPSFVELSRNNKLAAAASALQVSLNVARSEAIKQGFNSRVTVAANGTAGTWTNGWTVFVDKTSDANAAKAPTSDGSSATRVEVVGATSNSISTGQSGSLNYFSYNGQGRLIDVSGGGVVNRSFWFFEGTSQKYCLVVNNTGRVRMSRVNSADDCPTT
jgi:type IV fimbrial biogenesis protein FimT